LAFQSTPAACAAACAVGIPVGDWLVVSTGLLRLQLLPVVSTTVVEFGSYEVAVFEHPLALPDLSYCVLKFFLEMRYFISQSADFHRGIQRFTCVVPIRNASAKAPCQPTT
jgi:hypothetical protein